MLMSSKMIHPSHPEHELEFEHEVTPYTCNGCWQLGFYSRYECSKCEFYLHKDCAQAIRRPTITHQFFPGCVFMFLESPFIESPFDPGRYCDACGLDIKGYNYHCYEEGWDLHPSCATLPYTRIEGDVKLELSQELTSKCYKCRKKRMRGKRKSWSYVSSCGECHLHVACVKDMLLENWKMSEVSDERAVVRREQKLHIVLDRNKRRSSGRFRRYMKIVKIALSFIMAAIVGDPTALVVGVISSLISQ